MSEETRSADDGPVAGNPAPGGADGRTGVAAEETGGAGTGGEAEGAVATARPGGGALRVLRSLAGFLRPLWIPLLAGLPVVVVTYLLWLAAGNRQYAVVSHAVEAQAGWVKSEIARDLDAREHAVEVLAHQVAATPPANAAAWDSAAAGLLSAGDGVRVVAWLDASLRPVHVAPGDERHLSLFNPRDDDLRYGALDEVLGSARPDRGAIVTASVALASGGRQVMVCAPVLSRGRAMGYVLVVTRVRDMLDAMLRSALARGYTAAVYEGPYLVYGPVWLEGGPEVQYANDVNVHAGALQWRVRLWPSEETARALESRAPAAILVLGMLTAFLLAALVYVVRAPRARV